MLIGAISIKGNTEPLHGADNFDGPVILQLMNPNCGP